MVIHFKNAYLNKLFQGQPVTGKPKYGSDVIVRFKKTVLRLQLADSIKDLRSQRGLNFEALKGNLKGYYSVRVDLSYRLILSLDSNGDLQISDVITIHDLSKHYQ